MKELVVLLAVVMMSGCASTRMVSNWEKTVPTRPLTQEELIHFRDNWEKLQVGMTKEEVISLLGPPQRFTFDPSFIYSSHSAAFAVFVWDRDYRVTFDSKTERVIKWWRKRL
jgi:hypothetical protein